MAMLIVLWTGCLVTFIVIAVQSNKQELGNVAGFIGASFQVVFAMVFAVLSDIGGAHGAGAEKEMMDFLHTQCIGLMPLAALAAHIHMNDLHRRSEP